MDGEVIRGQHLVYGVAGRGGRDSGWKFVASSMARDTNLEQSLITRTNVGLRTSDTFKGGFGYFGDITANGDRYAILCRYSLSLQRERTGRHFVQRNIVLLPYAQFVNAAGGHGLSLVDSLPSGGTFENVDSVDKLEPVSIRVPPTGPSEPPVAEADPRRLLAAMLHGTSVIMVWPTPSNAQLQALLEILPSNLRAYVTWCTCVAEVKAGASARLLIVNEMQSDNAATVFRVPTRDFPQERFPPGFAARLIDTLLEARAAGADLLSELHRYVNHWTGSVREYKTLLERAEAAAVRWSRQRRISGTDWSTAALEHAQALGEEKDPDVVASEREWLLTQITTLMNPETDRARYGDVVRLLRPTPSDLSTVAKTAAARVTDGDMERIQAFIAAFRAFSFDGDDVREQFLENLADKLAPNARSWELLLDLGRGKYDIPPKLRDAALARWTFAAPPKWKDIRAFFDFVKPQELKTIDRNSALLQQLTADQHGRLALELLRNGEESERIPASAREVSGEAILGVLADGPSKNFTWRNLLYLRLLAEARKDPAAFTKSASQAIVENFAEAYISDAYGVLSDSERDRIKEAVTAVVKHVPNKEGLFRLGVARRELASHASQFEQTVVTLAKSFASKSVGAADLERALSEAKPPVTWHAYATLYELESFDVAAFLRGLTQISAARAARHFLAIATSRMPDTARRERAKRVIDACSETLARAQQFDDTFRTLLQHTWSPQEAAQIDPVMAAMTLFWGLRPGEAARRPIDSTLPTAARFRLYTDRVRDLLGQLKTMEAVPLQMVQDRLAEAETGELAALRDVFVDAVKYLSAGALRKPDLAKQFDWAIGALEDAIADRENDRSRRK